jgi:hypothetical protein
VIPEKAQTVHQLAARKSLQELEEGTGYLHSGRYGVDKERDRGTFDEWVERESVRVGLCSGLAGKWTSFLAVEEASESPAKGNEKPDLAVKEAEEGCQDLGESATNQAPGSRHRLSLVAWATTEKRA